MAASSSDISRQLRLLLANPSDEPSLSSFLDNVDALVAECLHTQNSAGVLEQLEEDLQTIYHDVIDQSESSHNRIILSVLYHLRPILPSVSIISTWFDLVLRPALREPKLPEETVTHAKELIVSALSPVKQVRDAVSDDPDKDKRREKSREFRRRLMELYLLDAYNESSGEEVLEWAELDDAQKETKACWKSNLEDVSCLCSQCVTSQPGFPAHAAVLAAHPLMQSVINSLTLDNSSTECTIGITVVTKLLPIFAVKASEDLKRLLPSFFFILGRLVCWETRHPESSLPAWPSQAGGQRRQRSHRPAIDDPHDPVSVSHLHIRPEVEWERLEQTFTEPYTKNWEDALDEDKIRSKSERLLRGHVLHPLLIWRDADAELTSRTLERLTQEAFTNAVGRPKADAEPEQPAHEISDEIAPYTDLRRPLPAVHSPPNKLQISLQDMVSTSMALKSGLDLEILDGPSSRTRSPSRKSVASASLRSPSPDLNTIHEASGQRREVLMLRCELNFELWMARNNVRHIGRLYQDRVVSRFAEVERQGLHNKLRGYKTEIHRLQKDLKDHKEQALATRNEYANWNQKLQDKIKDFRHEKSSWQTEATEMRAAHKELQASFAAQGKLLSDANSAQVDRLHDYEKQIEQLIALQRLWESDVQKLNDQTELLRACGSAYKKMEQRWKLSRRLTLSWKIGQASTWCSDETSTHNSDRKQRQEITSLEAKLSISQKQLAVSRKSVPRGDLASYRGEIQRLSVLNNQLRERNSELREELEELKAMVELLKHQVSGRPGVISDPRASPFMGPTALNI
ncbi:hypothetical protein BC629DRAFT_1579276 [Irpex lacteus]|nr:hypothetical protein BC629DRAFT_1579276 [Irpex lacteus]